MAEQQSMRQSQKIKTRAQNVDGQPNNQTGDEQITKQIYMYVLYVDTKQPLLTRSRNFSLLSSFCFIFVLGYLISTL